MSVNRVRSRSNEVIGGRTVVSNILLSNLETNGRGCTYCFPHGPECANRTRPNNSKKKGQYRPWQMDHIRSIRQVSYVEAPGFDEEDYLEELMEELNNNYTLEELMEEFFGDPDL